MAKGRSVDEYLGFAQKATAKSDPAPASAAESVDDDGAYEDNWYQVLKAAQADQGEEV